MRGGTVAMIMRVNAVFPRERIIAEIVATGYTGDGSMADAGCVELAYTKLDREIPRARAPRHGEPAKLAGTEAQVIVDDMIIEEEVK